MAKKVISQGGSLSGVVELPGDKSLSHRYAILAALAEGRSGIANYSTAADCRSTLACLERLGVEIKLGRDRDIQITGAGLAGLKAPKRALDAENSGSTMRMLSGVLAGQSFTSTLTGDASLRRRPMRRVIVPLRQMGAEISSRDGDLAPLEIRGGKLRAIDYSLPVPSAQVKSAILLAGLYADGVTTVRESVRTRDHTELALREFGARVETTRGAVRVHPRPKLEARQLIVPGDLSAAVFLIGAALVLPKSALVLHNVGLNPTRAKVLDFLISMGADIHVAAVESRSGELVGDISVRHAVLAGGEISGAQVAEMIDELPMLGALGPFTEKGITIRDAKELRVKESDRIATLAEGLRRMGARVEEFPDGLRVEGRGAGKLRGAKVDPQGDHRIAMALAVAGLGADGDTVIQDAGCVAVSFPEFFETLNKLRGATE
ncbi:MAG TPA: 3-phosphoshikimate 1-carboxyvinyltransferase [Candidatus Limnocylindria bacterium]|nr:3-phosphoshikimate 1-carboxyvinyltransferase [Candidatus Limnocylindria bacterium]